MRQDGSGQEDGVAHVRRQQVFEVGEERQVRELLPPRGQDGLITVTDGRERHLLRQGGERPPVAAPTAPAYYRGADGAGGPGGRGDRTLDCGCSVEIRGPSWPAGHRGGSPRQVTSRRNVSGGTALAQSTHLRMWVERSAGQYT